MAGDPTNGATLYKAALPAGVASSSANEVQEPFAQTLAFGPGSGIIDRKAIQQGMLARSREALNHMQIRRGSAKTGLVGEIGGIDHQRIAFPGNSPADA